MLNNALCNTHTTDYRVSLRNARIREGDSIARRPSLWASTAVLNTNNPRIQTRCSMGWESCSQGRTSMKTAVFHVNIKIMFHDCRNFHGKDHTGWLPFCLWGANSNVWIVGACIEIGSWTLLDCVNVRHNIPYVNGHPCNKVFTIILSQIM